MILEVEMTDYRSWAISKHKGRFYATVKPPLPSPFTTPEPRVKAQKRIHSQAHKKLDKALVDIVMIIIMNKIDNDHPFKHLQQQGQATENFASRVSSAQNALFFT
jgi:hypothetical protein